MNSKVLDFIKENHLISKGEEIVAAVSGGADSIAMLVVLSEICKEYSCELSVCHINHKLRGEESERDARFTEAFAKSLSLPCKVYSVDINAIAKETGEGIEECARRVRYEKLSEFAKGGKIATAHTRSDNAETVLFNITRGSGLLGVCGIPAKRDNIIRPLLCVSREEVEAFLSDRNVEYITDSSNLTDDYTRNKIRHNIVPNLKEINPEFESAVGRLSCFAGDVVDYITEAAKAVIDNDEDITKLHNAVLSRYIMLRAKDEIGINLSSNHALDVMKIVREGKGKVNLSGNTFALFKDKKLYFYKENPPFCCDFHIGEVKTPYGEYIFSIINRQDFEKNIKVNKNLLNNALDYDKIKGSIILRSRIDGDKITLAKRNLTKSMRKLFGEAKVPEHLRTRYALLVRDNKVLWAESFGISSEAQPDDTTEHFLVIEKKEM